MVNGKIYIGETHDIPTRWSNHKTAARAKNPRYFSYLHRAMNKYGFDKFQIESIAQFPTEKEALDAEIAFIAMYKTTDRAIGYNLTTGGEGVSGHKLSEETRQKMSKAQKGRKHTEETKQKMSAAQKGRKHTEETIQKMSDGKKGAYKGEANPFYGKKHSQESLEKMSAAASKRVGPANPSFGRRRSEEYKKAMSLSLKGMPGRKKRYLSEQDIETIKHKKFTLKMTYEQIAAEYSVHWKTISSALRGTAAYAKKTPEKDSTS